MSAVNNRRVGDLIAKAILSAGKNVETLLKKNEKEQAQHTDSVRPEICVGAVVGLKADAHRHGSGGGVLVAGETGVVISLEGITKARFDESWFQQSFDDASRFISFTEFGHRLDPSMSMKWLHSKLMLGPHVLLQC